MSRVPPKVRQIVLERDLHTCVRCGTYLPFSLYSLHHRRPRGAGGSKRPDTNQPANLITLCGSATTPGGCHQWVESFRDDARLDGLLVGQCETPSKIPVLTHRGWLLLDNDGAWEQVTAA